MDYLNEERDNNLEIENKLIERMFLVKISGRMFMKSEIDLVSSVIPLHNNFVLLYHTFF